MRVYVMRHGDAAPPRSGEGDEARALTPLGEDEARAVGRVLRLGPRPPGVVYASPVRRALRTAELVAEELGAEPPVVHDGLGFHGEPLEALEAAMGAGESSVLLVTHEPICALLADRLACAQGGSGVRFTTATVLGVDVAPLAHGCGGEIVVLVPGNLARALMPPTP